mmetsp:Transcript_6538/g.10163  ORF Transcript_6538/g.10163 Transcript_6538/m.10163 type:complete len:107 (+) Transcript_6538:135-455(+)
MYGNARQGLFTTQRLGAMKEAYKKEQKAQEKSMDLSDSSDEEDAVPSSTNTQVLPLPKEISRGDRSTYRLHFTGPNGVESLDRTHCLPRDHVTEYREQKAKAIKFR